ncbi:MAG TPA: tyrosine-type recombinase/integrase [Rhizomicrobium sp.]|nr:tyrosine-type recombinase/integrase [Rhizomicrobium sp.]
MALYKREGSPFWWFEFKSAGKRVRGSTSVADKREARTIELKARKNANQAVSVKVVVTTDAASLRVEEAALRYFEEVKNKLAGTRNVKRDLVRLGVFFNDKTRSRRDVLLSDITDADVTALVKWRSEQRAVPPKATKKPEAYPLVSAGTVNHLTVRLQALFAHARREWKVKHSNEPNWQTHKRDVPQKKARVLEGNERAKIDLATRTDYEPLIAFASKSALRFNSCVTLEWPEVRWAEGVIVKPGKRRPGGREKIETVPITSAIAAILKPLIGHHPKRVFTYVAQRTRDGRIKGQRYPVTCQGAATMWKRICDKAEVENFGFHGLRRDRATEVWRATGNLVAVSRLLNHGDVSTTMKYLRRSRHPAARRPKPRPPWNSERRRRFRSDEWAARHPQTRSCPVHRPARPHAPVSPRTRSEAVQTKEWRYVERAYA